MFATAACAGNKTLNISAGRDIFKEDTGIYDYWEFDSGTKHTLYAGMFGSPYGYSRAALGFDLAGKLADMNVISIRLILNNYSIVGTPNVTAYGSANDSWTESSSTAFPATSGSSLFSENSTASYYVSPDIKTYILNQYAGDQYATIVLDSTSSSATNVFSPYSSEQSGGLAPILKVTYTQPSGDRKSAARRGHAASAARRRDRRPCPRARDTPYCPRRLSRHRARGYRR